MADIKFPDGMRLESPKLGYIIMMYNPAPAISDSPKDYKDAMGDRLVICSALPSEPELEIRTRGMSM